MGDRGSTLSQSDYQQLQDLFEQVVDLPPAEQAARVEELCRESAHLREKLIALLALDETDLAKSEQPTLFPSSDSQDLDAGRREIGGYEILGEMGRGGMGVVYRARQKSPERTVALKMIRVGRFAAEEDVRRFSNEVDAIAKLAHEGIVPIYEIGCHHGEHFYSMQLIDGDPFDAYLDSADFDEAEALIIFSQICDAVAFCHEHGVIHRDLKPSNVLLDDQRIPKLTDFGLAKHLERESDLTRTGEIMGTPGYMAPEQADDSTAVVNERADVYGLGAILYRILTGRPPINTADVNIVGAIKLVTDNDIIAPRLLNRGISRDLETICLKCLEGDPQKRYRDAGQLASDMRCYLDGEAISARPLTVARRCARWARQQPGLAVTWLAVGLFFGYHLIYYYSKVPAERLRELGFHQTCGFVAFAWFFGAYWFQRQMLYGRALVSTLFGWVTMDVGLLNLLLFSSPNAESPLVGIYFVLVAAAVLRFRIDLVVYVTALCFASYLVYAYRGFFQDGIATPEIKNVVPIALSIFCVGAVQYFALRRSSAAARLTSKQPGHGRHGASPARRIARR